MNKGEKVRAGVDIGGTFTDVVVERGADRRTTKILTTHHAPEEGAIRGLHQAMEAIGVAPGDVDLIIHGTTLATNALIERKGARTGLLTTQGFRDVLEIRHEHRYEQYDLTIALPEPLVPRRLRLPVSGRVDADGDEIVPLDEDQVRRQCETLASAGVEAVAIGFLHSYLRFDHEQRAAGIVREILPDTSLTLSCEVAPEMREYERFSTACANAYVQPLMASYLGRLEQRLAELGYTCPLLLMLSGGGLTSVETAKRFPVRLVESGPAGGAIFASHVAAAAGVEDLLAFDMGGTTAKLCLVDGGVPQTSREFEVARVWRFKKGSGLPLKIPVIEMVEIGAGGGSIASVDELGRVSVGPESAGSEPGPAAYGAGGTEPTVTDSDLLLGRLDPANFAGGKIQLDVDAARRAIAESIGRRQGFSEEMAAVAVSEMVEENMANASRVHAIERGTDLRHRVMVAFGGAAPNHALRLARKLGIRRVLVPRGAGVGSAIGFLRAPYSYEVTRSLRRPVSQLQACEIDGMLAEMAEEARAIVRQAAGDIDLYETVSVSMRYRGQGHEIDVGLPGARLREAGTDSLRQAFEEDYRRLYGRPIPGGEVEALNWSLTVSSANTAADAGAAAEARQASGASRRRRIVDPQNGEAIDVPVYWRAALFLGDHIEGPAIIAEDETSTLVTRDFNATVGPGGLIDCRLKEETQ